MSRAYEHLAQNGSSDAELLGRLREGDRSAYVALWARHISAALRVAHRLYPSRAEDLASEAFLAVYQQVAVSGNGPREAFRAYLFTTMRNTAIRWAKESSRSDTVAEIDRVDPRDGLAVLEEDAASAELLAAFQALPERWQRALWLSEVENVARPRIAEEFGIRPNAVSQLLGRARAGLSYQWLVQQVPAALRDDPAHVARLLPKYLTDTDAVAAEVEAHLPGCDVCAELHVDLRGAAAQIRGTTLSVAGFTALGVALPSVSPLSAGLTAGATAMAIGTVAGAGAAGGTAGVGVGLGVLVTGGVLALTLLVAPVVPGRDAGQSAAGSSSQSTIGSGRPVFVPEEDDGDRRRQASGTHDDRGPGDSSGSGGDRGTGTGDGTGSGDGTGTGDGPGGDGDPGGDDRKRPDTGRGNDDETIEDVDFGGDSKPDDRERRDRPRPEPDDDVPDPSTDPEAPLTVGLTSAPSSDYFAPTLQGATRPGARVLLQLEGFPGAGFPGQPRTFAADTAPDGRWSFDMSLLERDAAGTYAYRLWATDGTAASQLTTGSFTLLPIAVAGFEDNPSMPLDEASTTGVVMALQGPADGFVCLDSWTGQSAIIPLDGQGTAVRRVRLLTGGFYVFTFRACSGGVLGAGTEAFAEAVDPDEIFGPWGPGLPEDPVFEIAEM
ncbi:RNA polymerase sigma factor [Leucobacter sp.]